MLAATTAGTTTQLRNYATGTHPNLGHIWKVWNASINKRIKIGFRNQSILESVNWEQNCLFFLKKVGQLRPLFVLFQTQILQKKTVDFSGIRTPRPKDYSIVIVIATDLNKTQTAKLIHNFQAPK